MLFYSNKCLDCRLCDSLCTQSAHSFEGQHTLNRTSCISCGQCAKDCPTSALELCGKDYTIAELITEIEKDRAFFGKAGGVTLSGREPFMQGESVIRLLRTCREHGLSTAVETCDFADKTLILSAVPYVDHFLWDIKDTDEEHYQNIARLALSLTNCKGVEYIPYHAYGGTKATFLGFTDNGRKVGSLHSSRWRG